MLCIVILIHVSHLVNVLFVCVFWPEGFVTLFSVTLSLEAKLHLLHTYMNVTWLPLPSEVQVRLFPEKFDHLAKGYMRNIYKYI